MEDNISANAMIAEFMVWDLNNPSTFPIHLHQEEETQGNWKPLFHSDWNWLMEVVDKIENIKDKDNFYSYYFSIWTDAVMIEDNEGEVLFISNKSEGLGTLQIEPILFESKLEATYKAVVEFIKWFNDNK